MHESKVLERIRNNETACGVTLHLHDPSLFEMTASLDYDAIWLDLEHHSENGVHISELIRATRAGGQTDVIVRPGRGEFARMARLLEVGAHGIMYPGCTSVAEAEEVVRWAKFAPLGSRGFDGSNVDSNFMGRPMTEYLEWANANTFVIIQIEDIQTVELAHDIAKVDGVDMLMLGPADLSVRLGYPGQMDHPMVAEAQRRVVEAAQNAGKNWAITTRGPEHARQMSEAGAKLVFQGADVVFIKNALVNAIREFRQS
ncbi:HpcH/HpaI aldolase family protein [Aeoliella mucimassa]|uniref:2-keto-3-deoxy-L-rhamnonate aldolase n=1 Tax=Aeoliella mucimassa TaxID=2527972 RepID=A0A518AQ82_9BACT|nr:aldolase/citrate lyase family protein [Aeoliella mucimassa]QDU56879.1 2-keto-3-deoxy-L-rhamnonate aldolase [Aeoliella mucimassa]